MTIQPGIIIRHETEKDIPKIREINHCAFAGPDEAALVDLLRSHKKATISLVAVQDKQTVGHILFSPVTFDPPYPVINCLGLAPMAVLPNFQNKGIGSRLVEIGLQAGKEIGIDAVFVLGHIDYYPRFGFHPASDFNLNSEYDAGDAFMALELSPGALGRVSGCVVFAPEFKDVGA